MILNSVPPPEVSGSRYRVWSRRSIYVRPSIFVESLRGTGLSREHSQQGLSLNGEPEFAMVKSYTSWASVSTHRQIPSDV